MKKRVFNLFLIARERYFLCEMKLTESYILTFSR